ncbi:MAG TPA: FAD-dependent oxidoreductase [Clostridiales bacterium]|nr:FAD-dependent oxidoreductase [Clostridiales bacterium]
MNHYDVAIIGAGIAGLTAAIYSSRAGKSVVIFEGEGIGGQIASSPVVENYPAYSEISGMELSDKIYEQAINLGAELEFDKVVEIIPGKKAIIKAEYSEYTADKLIIATGAKHRHLGIEREFDLVGRGISYCAVCDGTLYKGGTVAVVGGGNTAVTSAIYLSGICKKVYLIHRRDEFRADVELAERAKNISNIEMKLSRTVSRLIGDDKISQIELNDGEILDLDALFVNIGQVPNTELVRDLLNLDESGFIIADESCKTKYDNIFVAGDVRTKVARQLTTAAADGTVAALA